MEILDWLFDASSTAKNLLRTRYIEHPVFGRIVMDTANSWFAESVELPSGNGNPSMSIDGDETGPHDDSSKTYLQLRSDWELVKDSVTEILFELNQNYLSNDPTRMLASPEDVWPTAQLLNIAVGPHGDFSLTLTFDWQDPRDSHQITLSFENWKCTGSSIDG